MKKIILLILLSLILTSCEQLKYEVYDLNEDGNLVCNGNLYVKQDFDFGSEYSFNGDKIQVGVLSGLIKRGLFVSENDDGINIIEIRNNYFIIIIYIIRFNTWYWKINNYNWNTNCK